MLTLNDIINVSFRKANFAGYRTEDVDNFIDQVRDSYDSLLKKGIEQKEKIESLTAENAQLLKKIDVLAAKIEEYRSEEDEIKSALVSAQKLGDASIREARHKAEVILKDASLKADRIVNGAQAEIVEQKKEMERLRKSVSDFRAQLLGLYKQHLTLINALPTQQRAEPAPVTKQQPMQAAPRPQQPVQAPVQQPRPQQPVQQPQQSVPVQAPAPAPVREEAAAPAAVVSYRTADQQRPAAVETPVESFEATREFHVDPVVRAAGAAGGDADHDLRYDVLNFDNEYDVAADNASPVGRYQRQE